MPPLLILNVNFICYTIDSLIIHIKTSSCLVNLVIRGERATLNDHIIYIAKAKNICKYQNLSTMSIVTKLRTLAENWNTIIYRCFVLSCKSVPQGIDTSRGDN